MACLLAWFLLALSASAQEGPAVVRRLTLPARDTVLAAGAPFRAAGFVAEGRPDLLARASTDGVGWTGWMAVGFEEAGGPRASGLIWFGGPYRYLEVAGDGRGVEVLFIDPGESPVWKAPPHRPAQDAPPVVSRAQWGCTPQACPSPEAPAFTTVTHLVVHHTAGANAAADWPAVVRSIWVLHVRGNGWNDIGYNYLVDPAGTVYEGRAGGDGVLGAHFSGVNGGTMGVAALGTYTLVAAPEAALVSLRTLLAWQAGKWSLDPAGRGLHAASGLVLNVVGGHRDAGLSARATSSTECPGNGLYVALPRLRREVRALLDGACPVSISRTALCLPPEAGAADVTVGAPAGCSTPAESQADWIGVEGAPGRLRLSVAANPGGRRTGAVRVAGREVSVTQAGAGGWPMPCVAPGAVVSAAGAEDGPVVAGSLISLYGTDLARGAAVAESLPLPPALGGAALSVNGRPVPLLYAAPGQINAQLPPNIGAGTARAGVTVDGVAGPETNFWVTEALPALFSTSDGRAIAVNFEDGRLNSAANPARPGGIVTLYLGGAGPVQGGIPAGGAAAPNGPRAVSLPASATVGGVPATVLYLGLAPGTAGVYQCNLLIPEALQAGDRAVVLTVSGAPSRPALLSVAPGR